jgi:Ty3 transposon capsid-like protein/Zinc knuckle
METHQVTPEGLPTAPLDPFVTVAEAQALTGRAIEQLQQRLQELTAIQLRQLELQQQLATMQNTATTLPTPKPPKIDAKNFPTFTGIIGKSNADKFIDGMERTFKAFGLQDEQRQVYYAVNQLRETASNWWFAQRQQQGTTADVWEATLSWAEFKDMLQRQFKPTDFGQQLRDRLYSLRQNTSVDAYTNVFQDLVSQLPSMSEDDRIYHYIRGLKTNTAAHVRAAQPTTLQHAIEKASTYDHAVFQRGRRNGSSPFRRSFTAQQPQVADRMDIDHVNVQPGQQPTTTTAQPRRDPRTIVCYKCQKPGHIARYCRSPTSSRQGNASRQ